MGRGTQAAVARFDRYMLSQLLVVFGFFALVLVLVYWVNQAVILFDRLIADGQSAAVVLELTVLSLPTVIATVLPLAAFVASVYVTNRLSSESELTVVQATGFSPFRLARPVLVYGLFVAAMTMVLSHILVPASLTALQDRRAELAENVTARLLTEGQFLHPASGVTFYFRDISALGELRDIYLADRRPDGDPVTYTAERAYLVRSEDGPRMVMLSGTVQRLTQPGDRLFVTFFNDFTIDIGTLLADDGTRRRNLRELGTLELLTADPDAMAETRSDAGRMVELGHARIAGPSLAVVAALLGFAPLIAGGFSRFGLWRRIIVAVLLIVPIKASETVVSTAVRDNPDAWPLMYVPVAFGLFIAWLFLWSATRGPVRVRAARPAEGGAA